MLKLNPKKKKAKKFPLKIQDKTQVAIFIAFLIIAFNFYKEKEENETTQLAENGRYTIGKVTKLNYRKQASIDVTYTFFHAGKWIEGENLIDKDAEIAPVKGAYYLVRYVPNDLNISEILVASDRITREVALENAQEIFGDIEIIRPAFPNYIRIKIGYTFEGERYQVESILHKDSLPCGTFEACKESKRIPIKVSKKYPFFTDVFYRSSQRRHSKLY
jgi:hypothetical protein